MVSVIPCTASFGHKVYTRKGRMSIILENAPRYRRASRKVKSQLLDELSRMLHYHRTYLASLLRNGGRDVYTPQGLRLIADPKASLVSRRGRKKRPTPKSCCPRSPLSGNWFEESCGRGVSPLSISLPSSPPTRTSSSPTHN